MDELIADPTSVPDLLSLTAGIVSAHVAGNKVHADALPGLIRAVHDALSQAGSMPIGTDKPKPAVAVQESVFPEYLVCLEDGKKLKTLKRHLQAAYGMSPADYRQKWYLPADYPMTAPNYAAKRSALAKQIGLGRKNEVSDDPENEPLVVRIPEGMTGKKAGKLKAAA